jgi:hypothetical protein
MISIDEHYVDSAAPNPEAGKNGRGLVLKGKFLKFHISEDETILFGECQGSGKEPYRCSCDFMQPEKPTHRCSCPSRQFPCKHCLGLMYAFALGKTFKKAVVPDDLQAKREKLQTRVEKKKEEAEKPRKVNTGALAKKIQAQLKGIDVLESLTHDLVRLGIGNMNAKIAHEIEEQAKQLGNAYLPGAQAALHSYTNLFAGEDGSYAEQTTAQRELVFSEALDQLGRLQALVKQGRAYLKRRSEDPELKPETDSSIAAWLGHAWQLRELGEAGLVELDVELVQLAFNSHDDPARQEYIDTGVWMNLGTGRIGLTKNYRPYKAAKFIKSDDSFFQVAQVKEMCIYPGEVNPRIRWDGQVARALEARDFQAIRKHGQGDFAAAVKEVKGHLKGPLSEKQPIVALNFQRLGQVEGTPVVEDSKGERLALTDRGMEEEPQSCHLLTLLPRDSFREQTLIARFRHDLDQRTLRIKPLSLVTPDAVIRLTL